MAQAELGKQRIIAIFSRKLRQNEVNFSVLEKELLAIVECLEFFKLYVFGCKVVVYSDQKPFQWLLQKRGEKYFRYKERLLCFEARVVYLKGKNNVADWCLRYSLQARSGIFRALKRLQIQ